MKKTLCFLVIFIASFSIKAQMDSIRVNVFLDGEVQSPFDSTQLLPLVKMDLFVDDYDFFGEVLIEAYAAANQQIFSKLKFKKDELLQLPVDENGFRKIELLPKFDDIEFNLIIRIRDYQGVSIWSKEFEYNTF